MLGHCCCKAETKKRRAQNVHLGVKEVGPDPAPFLSAITELKVLARKAKTFNQISGASYLG